MKSFILSLLILGSVITGARGENYRTDINPGLRYWEAFMLAQNVPKDTRDHLMTNEWRGRPMPAKVGEQLSSYDTVFRLLRTAAHAEVPCDFGLDLTEGPELLLPHLAQAKALSQIARMRAMWDLQNGKQVEARDDLLAAFAMARNVAHDGTLISVLVEIAMENILINTVAENYYRFTPETLKQLDEGFASAPARGTVAEAIATGEGSFGRWLAQKVQEAHKQYAGDEAATMASLRKTVGNLFSGERDVQTKTVENLFRAAGGTSDGLLRIVNELPAMYERLAKIMALPLSDYEAQIRLFNTEVQNSPNPLIVELMPAVMKSRPKEFSILGRLAMLHAAVEYKLNGSAGFNAVMDPLADGPFTLERFSFQGIERGIKIKSPYTGGTVPQASIFVEKEGPPFLVWGLRIGETPSKD